MKRCLIVCALLLAFSVAHAATTAPVTFTDAASGVTFEIPARFTPVTFSATELTRLKGPDGTTLIARLDRTHAAVATNATVARAAVGILPGAVVTDTHTLSPVSQLAVLETKEGLKGLAGVVVLAGGTVTITAVVPPESFLATFFDVRALMQTVRIAPHDDTSRTNAILKRLVFAQQNGEDRCETVIADARVASQTLHDTLSIQRIRMMTTALETGATALPFEDSSLVTNLYAMARRFSLIARADTEAQRGQLATARNYLEDFGPDTLASVALRMKLARLENDTDAFRRLSHQAGETPCGRTGAVIHYERGMQVRETDPAKAARLFEEATRKAPAWAPAYVALGQTLLQSGVNGKTVLGRMRSSLARAPRTPELAQLSKGLGQIR